MIFAKLEFEEPLWALLGVVGFLFFFCDFFHFFKKFNLPLPFHLASPSGQPSRHRQVVKFLLFLIGLIAWVSLTLALMGPKKRVGETTQDLYVSDILFVVDVSRSMLANDFTPNRLEAAKKKIQEFIGLGPADQMGIILFSEKVLTLLPLTTDVNVLKEVVSQITLGELGSGTNIGDAIGVAVARSKESSSKNKVIILLTDGVSQVDTIHPLEATLYAKKEGIKIYAIAIGHDQEARIPMRDSWGMVSYQKIPGGSVDFEMLKEMAHLTKGRAYLAKDERALEMIFADIESLEKTKIEKKEQGLYQNFFYVFMFWGVLGMMLVEILRRFLLREVV